MRMRNFVHHRQVLSPFHMRATRPRLDRNTKALLTHVNLEVAECRQ